MVRVPSTPRTRFGVTLVQLMAGRDVRTFRALSELLGRRGHRFGPGSFAGWTLGHRPAPKALPSAVAEALKLDAEERALLADAFAYGQDRPATADGGRGVDLEQADRLHTRGVKEGAAGEELEAQGVLDVLAASGEDGLRAYLYGFRQGASYRRREGGR